LAAEQRIRQKGHCGEPNGALESVIGQALRFHTEEAQ
jgi:hypothetical protein